MVRNLVFFDPPLGEIHLHKLLSLARKRLQFLQLITESMTFDELSEILSQTHEDLAEAVSCGSKKDRISHFALALAAQVDPEFQAFLLKKETLFLKLRLSQSSEADQVQALTRMAHHLKLRTRLRHDLELFRLFTAIAPICDKELWQDVQVPFQWVSQLVSDRRVSLVNGLAQIDITLCPDLLLSLFSSLKKMDWNDSRATDSMPQKDDLSLSSPSEMLLCPFLESAQKVDGEQSGSVWIVEANRQCQQHLAAKLITSLGLEDISFTKPSKYYAIASQD
ncbi:hypothetical protein TCAL_15668 [Tigriopus californicus]|uniref:Uncharacterized protein n=1 Tax=Tigriopus californicus TaxID=6832 RepID=A0A553PCA0_TIGCA|nr:hypothetical protein TCAL_15668 [Tigriopus californicus]